MNESPQEKKLGLFAILQELRALGDKNEIKVFFPEVKRNASGKPKDVTFILSELGEVTPFLRKNEVEADQRLVAEYRFPIFSSAIVKEYYEMLEEEPFFATLLRETISSTSRGPVVGHKVEVEPERDADGKIIFDDDGLPILSERAELKPKTIDTACIWYDPRCSRFRTYYNPVLLSYLSGAEKKQMIMHEHFHALFKHVGPNASFRRLTDNRELAKRWNNIAWDLAINSHLEVLAAVKIVIHEWVTESMKHLFFEEEKFRKSLNDYSDLILNYDWVQNASEEDLHISYALLHSGPFAGCSPGELTFKDFPKYLTSEAYFYLLQERQKEQQKARGDGGGGQKRPSLSDSSQFDVHLSQEEMDQGEDSSGGERQEISRITGKAAAEAKRNKKGWGSVTQDMQDEIEKFLSNEISWEKQLEFFIRKSGKSNRYSTFKKANKRYRDADGFSQAPGRKVNRQSKIHVFIDESGSVDNGTLERFFAVLRDLSKYTSFVLIPFDTEVKLEHKVVWEYGNPYKKIDRVACGGTSFECVTKYCNENKSLMDGYIIFTDFLAPQPSNSMVQRIWIGSEADANACRFNFKQNEKVVRIKNEE